MVRRSYAFGVALLAAAWGTGCSDREVATIVGDGPTLDATMRPSIVRGTPEISEELGPDGMAAYTVRFEIEPAVPGQIPPPGKIHVEAKLTGTTFQDAPAEAEATRRDGKEAITVKFDALPPETSNVRLNLDIDGSRGSFELEHLKSARSRPRLGSKIASPYGPIVAIGVRDLRRNPGDLQPMAGIALELPWRSGFVRRLRDLQVYPASRVSSNSKLSAYVEDGSRPGILSLDRYRERRWECKGQLDFLSVVEQGDIAASKSPVLIKTVQAGSHLERFVTAKGTSADGKEVQILMEGGLWFMLGEGWRLDQTTLPTRYRILRVAETIPFAVQEDTINAIPVTGPRFRAPVADLFFDLNSVLAKATTKGSAPQIGRSLP